MMLNVYFQSEEVLEMYPGKIFPEYGSSDASGFDLRANEEVSIPAGETRVIGLGVHFGIPGGYELQIRSRSGLAAKHGLFILNSPGTIDADYTGEVKAIVSNFGSDRIVIERGDRICQAVYAEIPPRPIIGSVLSEEALKPGSVRGGNGFGSTGIK